MITNAIRLHRLSKNYTQDYMAFSLGISQKAYSKIEAGITKLTVERLLEIASILELDAEAILNSSDPIKSYDSEHVI